MTNAVATNLTEAANAVPTNALLQDLAMVMIVAGVVTMLFHRLRQPVVLGYILAGLIIGPHTPFFFLTHMQSVNTMAELGVVFLIFGLGLQFSLRTLKRVGATAFVASSLEILFMLWVGYRIGQWFGWARMDSLFLGAMLSITSTTIIVKTLTDLGLIKSPFAQLVFGIQIVEDTLGMTMIALLSGIAMTGVLQWDTAAKTAGVLVVFLSAVLVVGLLAVPPLVRHVTRYQSEEMLLVTALGLCFGVTLLAVRLGYSVALGAFLIGTIIGETREIGLIKRLMGPLRDMFSAVFFVAIGMMLDPALLVEHARAIVVIVAAVLVGKMAAFTAGTFVAGHNLQTALRVGTSMVPIGELSIIIASLGLYLGVISEFLYPIAVCVSVVTIFCSPYMIRASDPFVRWVERRAPPALVNYLNLYSQWVDRMRNTQPHNQARRMVRKWLMQAGLNVLLATAAFLTAVATGPLVGDRWPWAPVWLGGAKGVVWLLAAVVALPALIAAIRKLDATAMLLSEMAVSHAAAGRHAAAIRLIVSRTIFSTALVGLALWVMTISAAILPGGPALVVLLVLVAAVTLVFWRYMIQIHARAQVALRDLMVNTPPAGDEASVETVLPGLKELQTTTVRVESGSAVAGRLLREVELRTRTGAVAVAIDRDGHRVAHPGPDDELTAGDSVLLVGTPQQLEAARTLFGKRQEEKSAQKGA